MGSRFCRSFRVLPFLRLNIGKRGSSVSIGGRGAHVTRFWTVLVLVQVLAGATMAIVGGMH
jgi:hypothetical protein